MTVCLPQNGQPNANNHAEGQDATHECGSVDGVIIKKDVRFRDREIYAFGPQNWYQIHRQNNRVNDNEKKENFKPEEQNADNQKHRRCPEHQIDDAAANTLI